jgi:hypothetical protein
MIYLQLWWITSLTCHTHGFVQKTPNTTSIQDQHFPQEWFVKGVPNCEYANRKRLLYGQLQQRQPHYFPRLICCHQPREPCVGTTQWVLEHIFVMTQQPPACQSLLIIEASQSHSVKRTTRANSCRPMPWTGLPLGLAEITVTAYKLQW